MSGADTVLVVGAGGREHAIVWALSASPAVGKVIVTPGNGGTSGTIGSCVVENASATSVPDIVALCESTRPRIVIVGPEAPLAEGLAGEWLRGQLTNGRAADCMPDGADAGWRRAAT